MWIMWKLRFQKCEFCGKWDFKNVNFVKNEILERWILRKLRLQKGEFCKTWDFQYVHYWINCGFLPQCDRKQTMKCTCLRDLVWQSTWNSYWHNSQDWLPVVDNHFSKHVKCTNPTLPLQLQGESRSPSSWQMRQKTLEVRLLSGLCEFMIWLFQTSKHLTFLTSWNLSNATLFNFLVRLFGFFENYFHFWFVFWLQKFLQVSFSRLYSKWQH